MAATRRIGEVFVERGFVTAEDLDAALEVQRQTGQRVGEILIAQGKLSRLDLASALSEHWDVRDLAPGDAPVLPAVAEPAVLDPAGTETRLRELEETAAKLQSNETGDLLLRLESQITTLSDRHATSLRESNETQERLQNELLRLHTEIAARDATMTDAIRAADANASQTAHHTRHLDQAFQGQLEHIRAELAELRAQIHAFASQQTPVASGGNDADSKRKAKKKRKSH